MKRRQGFTLVELLVVIAIIVLLMGVLLPAINRAHVACLSGLKQLTTGWPADDHTGDMPYSGLDRARYSHRDCMLFYDRTIVAQEPISKTITKENTTRMDMGMLLAISIDPEGEFRAFYLMLPIVLFWGTRLLKEVMRLVDMGGKYPVEAGDFAKSLRKFYENVKKIKKVYDKKGWSKAKKVAKKCNIKGQIKLLLEKGKRLRDLL